jgi:integrase
MKLTTASIRTIEPIPPKTDRIEFDDGVPGFGVRARKGGSKVYIVQYAIGEKTRRMTLGKVSLQGVDKAREKAKDILAAVRMGKDPAGEKQQARETATDTFKAVAERFLAFQKAHGGKDSKGVRPRSLSEAERHLMKHAKTLHGLLFAKIQQRDIASVISAVRAKHPVTANRVRTSLATLFSWAISEGLTNSNAVTGTKRTDEKSRDRVLDPAELRLIWNALEDDHFGAIIKLLMLTGQRADEIASLRWSEITEATVKEKKEGATIVAPEFNVDAIDLPPERTKNGKPHIVPLSKPALAIISAQPRDRVNSDGNPRELIFGFGQRGFSGWGKSKETLDKRIAEKIGQPLPHWTPHDLRRTMSTKMNDELDVLPHVVEAILNHISSQISGKSGVSGTYNKAVYLRERVQALRLWSEYLVSIIEDSGGNVTTLKRG